jgi:hypothetical protein
VPGRFSLGQSVRHRDPPSRGDPGAPAAQVSGLGDQLWGWSIRGGNGGVGLPTGEIYRHPVATKVINRRTRWWDRCAGRPGAWRNPGALGRGTVGAPVIVALAPRLKVVFVCHRARGCMLPGTLVLRAVGRLQSLHPHARRGNDAQGEHQQPKDPGGPRVGRSDHHDWDHRRTDANVQPNPPIPHGIPFDPTKILLRSPLGHRRSLLNTRAIRDRPLGTTSVSNSVTMRYRRHAPDGDFAADAALVAGSMAGISGGRNRFGRTWLRAKVTMA